MRTNDSGPWCSALVVALVGCIDSAHVRQHDGMVTAVARAESDPARHADASDASLVVDGHLDRAAVVAAVLARNPDLDAARAAWRAAVAAYPSAIALDDPMARYALAPFDFVWLWREHILTIIRQSSQTESMPAEKVITSSKNVEPEGTD